MGANAAPLGGQADHQIVKPRLWNESEGIEKLVRGLVGRVDLLHENRPIASRGFGQAAGGQGPMQQSAVGQEQAAGQCALVKELEQPVCADRWLLGAPVWEGSLHKQGLALPVPSHELAGSEAAQPGQGAMNLQKSPSCEGWF